MTCVNGDSYSGEYLEGRRHGNGVFKYAKGSVYEGMWVSNMMQGFGHFYSHEGWSYKGNFQRVWRIPFAPSWLPTCLMQNIMFVRNVA